MEVKRYRFFYSIFTVQTPDHTRRAQAKSEYLNSHTSAAQYRFWFYPDTDLFLTSFSMLNSMLTLSIFLSFSLFATISISFYLFNQKLHVSLFFLPRNFFTEKLTYIFFKLKYQNVQNFNLNFKSSIHCLILMYLNEQLHTEFFFNTKIFSNKCFLPNRNCQTETVTNMST